MITYGGDDLEEEEVDYKVYSGEYSTPKSHLIECHSGMGTHSAEICGGKHAESSHECEKYIQKCPPGERLRHSDFYHYPYEDDEEESPFHGCGFEYLVHMIIYVIMRERRVIL